jgi:hypothetical protein
MYIMLGLGVVFLLAARFIARSAYFSQPTEAYDPSAPASADDSSA